jgi:DNA processing protein
VTAIDSRTADARVCPACSRRGWLLAALAGPLDYWCRDRDRLLDALALGDDELIEAVGGRRRRELARSYAAAPAEPGQEGEAARRSRPICRHQPSFPVGLRFACGPRTVRALPATARLCELARGPVVALLGSARASDYGMDVGRALGRGLAAAGVAVSVLASDGICAAALAGALEGEGSVLCTVPCGLDVAVPAVAASAGRGIKARGCVLSELPCGTPARQWAQAAGERVVVGLAQLTIVVEAGDSRRELAPARLAQALERPLAAVPGRVTSTLSSGTNGLLAAGAAVVRGPLDALELLGVGAPPAAARRDVAGALAPALRLVLEEVSSGRDTPDLLVRADRPLSTVLHALSELELRDLLVRGDGGRYLPRAPTAAPRSPARARKSG